MSEVSSESLFHYTKEKESLLGILQNGFRMSYSFEDFDEDISHFKNDNYNSLGRPMVCEKPRYGIAIPMICFCDIPLPQTKKHREYYGSYCVGLDKEAFFEQYRAVINPVFYYYEDSWKKDIMLELVRLKKRIGKKEGCEIHSNEYYDLQFYAKEIISLAKPYSGFDTEGRFKRFYDEREWRITFIQDKSGNAPDFIYGLQLDDFKEKKEHNELGLSNYLVLNKGTAKDVVSHIIVPEEKDIPEIVDAIKEFDIFMGAEISCREKCKLMKKVTSFQEISKDYSNVENHNKQ